MAATLLIVGAGGHGKVVADAAMASGGWNHIAFVDDRYPCDPVLGFPVVGNIAALAALQSENPEAIVAIGAPVARLDMLARIHTLGYRRPKVVHPAATVSPFATLGEGTVVLAQAVINPGAVLGVGVIVNTGAIVEHDCSLADGVHLCPRAVLAGTVTVGPRAWIGVGSCVRNNLVIHADVTVGAGAVVVKDLSAGMTAVGVPARPHSH